MITEYKTIDKFLLKSLFLNQLAWKNMNFVLLFKSLSLQLSVFFCTTPLLSVFCIMIVTRWRRVLSELLNTIILCSCLNLYWWVHFSHTFHFIRSFAISDKVMDVFIKLCTEEIKWFKHELKVQKFTDDILSIVPHKKTFFFTNKIGKV